MNAADPAWPLLVLGGDPVARLLLSVALLAAVGGLAAVDLRAGRGPGLRVLGWVGLVATLGAASISLGLIWTRFITRAYLWNAWWLLSGVSLTAAHILLLFHVRRTVPLLVIRNVTLAAVLVFASIVIAMTFRRDVFAMPGPFLSWCIYVAGAVEVAGSLALLLFGRPAPSRLPIPWTALRAARWAGFPILVCASGFYLGRVTAPPAGVLDGGVAVLPALGAEALDAQVKADLRKLQEIAAGIERGRSQADALRESLLSRMQAEGRSFFTPDEDDSVRALFFSYLAYRTVLLRMVAFYQGYATVRDPGQRASCFLVGATAGAVSFGSSLALVAAYHGEPLIRAKLNEPEPVWGIPAGMFDRIQESVALEKHLRAFEEMLAYFESRRGTWRGSGLPEADVAWLETTIEHAAAGVKTNPLFGSAAPMEVVLARVKSDAYAPVYAVQSLVSEWMGDTRLVARPSAISREQVEEIRKRIRPGDIILERRNWFLSNAFLPGFWPHAALYVGTGEDIRLLGIAEEPAVRDRWTAFREFAHDGTRRCVIESISEGVSFSSLGEATLADYIAVLRPRKSEAERARAILRAFSHQGKPYDFEFDFFSSDKLVCTELVYRAYEGALHFGLVKIMGRATLPAVEIARKFVRERGTPHQELDFVLFLDTPAGGERAVFRDVEEFCAAAERPRAFNE